MRRRRTMTKMRRMMKTRRMKTRYTETGRMKTRRRCGGGQT